MISALLILEGNKLKTLNSIEIKSEVQEIFLEQPAKAVILDHQQIGYGIF